MRDATTKAWRDFLSGYRNIHFYTVDPGAHAIASELVPLVENLNQISGWFAEGWSVTNNPRCKPAATLISTLRPGDTLLIGSQTNYSRTQEIIREAVKSGAEIIFVFDHWKNYSEHFDGELLPNVIVVQDSISHDQLLAAVGERASARIRVLPHPGIDAAAERVSGYGQIVQQRSLTGWVMIGADPSQPPLKW